SLGWPRVAAAAGAAGAGGRAGVPGVAGTAGLARGGLGGRPLGGADLDHAVHRVGGDLGGDHLGVGDLAIGQVLADGDGAFTVAALLDHAGLAFVQVVGLALDHLVLDRFGLLLGLGAVPHDRDGGGAVLGAGDRDVVLLADVDLGLPQRLAQRHGAVHLD